MLQEPLTNIAPSLVPVTISWQFQITLLNNNIHLVFISCSIDSGIVPDRIFAPKPASFVSIRETILSAKTLSGRPRTLKG
jgi:hypothetical protein